MTSIAIIGAAGRMGGALLRCAGRLDGVKVVAAVDRPGHPAMGQDIGTLAGTGPAGVRLSDDPEAMRVADVAVDFSFHTAVPANVATAARLGKGVVLGTTGLSGEEAAAVRSAAAKVPVMWAPNMSLGVNLLFVMVEQAARALGLDYDAEIVEVHHRLKKDAPSGTALRLGENVAAGRGQDFKTAAVYGREGMVGERPKGEIGLHAVRSGDVVGDHAVSFATEGEIVTFSHRATSRDTFAMGALRAALWVAGRAPGFYDMKDVLGL